MKKNIFKKVVVLLGLSFVLLGFNTVIASDADTIAPIISLVGDSNISINVGDSYTDAGATVSDNVDTNIVASTSGTVDTSVANTYTITYSAIDSSGNPATPVTRTVIVNAVVPPAPVSPKETFIIRGDGGNLIWEGQIDLPSSGKATISGKEIDARSVLAVLSLIDSQHEEFSISDLPYSDSFGSFYLKCITPKGETPLCDNWQYAVGQVTPWTAIDKTPLVGDETVGIYFGSSHHLVINKNTLTTSDLLSVTSEKYNYESNLWIPLTGVNIGLTLPNPNDQWNPIVVNKYPVDTNGVASFNIKDANTYTVGIDEDYYFPSYQVVVSAAPVSGGGGAPIVETKVFSLQNAISYLSSSQKSNGSFGDDLYTDWAAIGISQSPSDAKSKISNYLKNNTMSSSVVTDNERHAMALMAIGIDPYSGTSIDYIKKITDSFDGNQIGNSSLLNDDIFGLIVLKNAGYTSSDNLIVKDINYLVSKQLSNGSFGGIDLTAAAIQALNNFKDISSVNDSISKALNYLAKSQESDGGFGNSFATSWVIQALSTNSSLYNSEISKADNYLTIKQQEDGGVDAISNTVDNRVWATSYAIPAILHLSWNNILNPFSKPSISSSPSSIAEEKKIETPIVLELPKVIAKTEEIKTSEKKVVQVILKKIKNTKIKPIIKSTKNNTEIKSSVDVSSSESLPVIKKNIFIQAGSSIILGIKALFSWLF